jgi:hypothetical protein
MLGKEGMSQNDSPLAAFDYPEPPSPIWRCLCRRGRRDRQRGVQQVANRPNMLGDTECHCWRILMLHIRRQSLMNAAEIVVCRIQAHDMLTSA